jgi:hypothetical protein
MEPEILLRILHGQGGLGSASANHSKKWRVRENIIE